jgi:hypothetical protein
MRFTSLRPSRGRQKRHPAGAGPIMLSAVLNLMGFVIFCACGNLSLVKASSDELGRPDPEADLPRADRSRSPP